MEALSPLISYSLKGLESCWMDDQKCWAHAFHPDIKTQHSSIPHSDIFYSLNVLLGLSRLPGKWESTRWKVDELFPSFCDRMLFLPMRAYAYGMALWAGAELGLAVPSATVDKIDRMMREEKAWLDWTAQDVGMLISGLSSMVKKKENRWRKPATRLKRFSDRHFSSTKSGLFYDSAKSVRRQFTTFATHVYLTLANFHFGEAFEDEPSIQRALRCVDALERTQGPRGEWPWFYHAPSGRVMDMYPVYSVHQDGMAPAYLRHAMTHGHPTAREQIIRGFKWILGNNELNQSMLMPEHGIILRSQIRNESHERYKRAFRSMKNWVLRKEGSTIEADRLSVNRECRSYHLGWVLWSFDGRSDFPELTHHNAFNLETG